MTHQKDRGSRDGPSGTDNTVALLILLQTIILSEQVMKLTKN